MQWKLVIRDVGRLLHLPALLALALLPVALFNDGLAAIMGLLVTSALALTVAQLLMRLPFPGRLERPQPSVTVTLTWIGLGALGALPYLVCALWAPDRSPKTLLSFRDPLNAWFESLSGFTGTGLTVTGNPAELPASLQLWRSLSEWIGSLGVVVVGISALRLHDDDWGEFESEGRTQHLLPTMQQTANRIWVIYLGYSAVTVLALRVAGASWWSSIHHGLTAISTGGFSLHEHSLAPEAQAVQAIAWVAMLLGALGFDDHQRLWTGQWRQLLRTPAVGLLFLLVGAGGLLLGSMSSLTLWEAYFLFGSAQSTGGLATASVAKLPEPSIWLLAAATTIGGCVGSTAGGLKLRRPLVAVRLLPRCWLGREHGKEMGAARRAVPRFVVAYLLVLALGSLAIIGTGVAVTPAVFEMASALSNCGLSAGVTSAGASGAIKAILMVAMLLGRLEILPFAVLVAAALRAPDAERRLEQQVESD